MFMKLGLLAVPAAAALTLAACASPQPAPAPTQTGGTLRVVAAFYPLQYAAQRVAGDRAQVTGLTPPGVEPHDLELTPSQVAAIRDADLVIYLPGFQPAVDEAVKAEAGDRALDASAGLTLLPATEAEAKEAAADGAPVPTSDPHVWLNPLNLAAIGSTVNERLAALAPDARESFSSGLRGLTDDMKALDSRWSSGTATCASRDLVVSHSAFGYLADRYRFTQIGISGLVPDAEPAPATIADVTDFVRSNSVRTIYYETLVDPKVATVIAQETGAATAVLDPLEGVAEGSSDTYITVMDRNLATVIAGQPCS